MVGSIISRISGFGLRSHIQRLRITTPRTHSTPIPHGSHAFPVVDSFTACIQTQKLGSGYTFLFLLFSFLLPAFFSRREISFAFVVGPFPFPFLSQHTVYLHGQGSQGGRVLAVFHFHFIPGFTFFLCLLYGFCKGMVAWMAYCGFSHSCSNGSFFSFLFGIAWMVFFVLDWVYLRLDMYYIG